MSVYKRPGAETYSYDFRYRGHRFSGDTGQAQKREALKFEHAEKTRAKAKVADNAKFSAQEMTWEIAMSRYWEEIGQHQVNATTTLACLEWLTHAIGRNRPVIEIDDNLVAAIVAKRRGEGRRVGRAKDRSKQPRVSAATVNRTATEPLRKVLLRARKFWKVKTADVDWGAHMLAEPRERIREASVGEEGAVMAGLERGYDEAVQFAFRDGCRRMEVCGLVWARVDFFGRQYTVIGKGGKERVIPMSRATYEQFKRLLGQHQTFVFTFIAQKTRREFAQVRGRRYPIKPERLSKVLKKAAVDGSVGNFHLHDTRHTAATRALRKSNLKVVQELLGHENIATTTKYAHAMKEDVRAALDAVSATKNATQDQQDGDNVLGNKRDVE